MKAIQYILLKFLNEYPSRLFIKLSYKNTKIYKSSDYLSSLVLKNIIEV